LTGTHRTTPPLAPLNAEPLHSPQTSPTELRLRIRGCRHAAVG
jgi:hypothetical protein